MFALVASVVAVVGVTFVGVAVVVVAFVVAAFVVVVTSVGVVVAFVAGITFVVAVAVALVARVAVGYSLKAVAPDLEIWVFAGCPLAAKACFAAEPPAWGSCARAVRLRMGMQRDGLRLDCLVQQPHSHPWLDEQGDANTVRRCGWGTH